MFEQFHTEIFIGIGIPAIGAGSFIVRHFWLKTKCFYLMKQELEQIKEENKEGIKIHKELSAEMKSLMRDVSDLKGSFNTMMNLLNKKL